MDRADAGSGVSQWAASSARQPFSRGRFVSRADLWEVDTRSRTAVVWLEHPSLAHAADPFHPVPQFPGVNGLKIFGDTLYASSTEQQKLVRIPLGEDGSAGRPEVFMTSINLDDFAFDVEGNLYGTTHVYNNVVRITPARVVTVVAELAQGLAGSTAAGFGRTDADRTALYVTTNGGMSSAARTNSRTLRPLHLKIGICKSGYSSNTPASIDCTNWMPASWCQPGPNAANGPPAVLGCEVSIGCSCGGVLKERKFSPCQPTQKRPTA